jgi:hypothetical protein
MSGKEPRSVALDRLAGFLTAHDPTIREIDLDVIKDNYGYKNAGAAWSVRIAPGADERRIDVIADPNYPYARPDIGISDLPLDERPYAGIFSNDTLCIDSPDRPFPISTDDSMIIEVLDRVRERMVISTPEDAIEARRPEFDSYWNSRSKTLPIFSLLDDRGPSREIFYATYSPGTFCAETRDDLVGWLVNSGRKVPTRVCRSVVLDLAASITTRPETNLELLNAVEALGNAHDIEILKSVALATDVPVPVVLRVSTPDGTSQVAAWLDDPRVSVGKKKVTQKWHGFAKGHAPVGQIAPRFFLASGKLTRGGVKRVDPAWLFSRGGYIYSEKLLQSKVVIIGAGSLGSSVARRLVKAGVGNMVIVDPQLLTWDNVARHELGGRHVDESKAKALATILQCDFPYLKVSGHFDGWEDVWRADPTCLSQADLIISTVAEAGPELHLNVLARTELFPPVLFGWLEERAGAAQALLVGGQGGCLGCGMSKYGVFSERVISNPNKNVRRVPGCDDFYHPYTALEADSGIAMIVETALDNLTSGSNRSKLTTWVGDTTLIKSEGGSVRDQWIALHGEFETGRRRYVKEWPIEPSCPLCAA